MDCPICNYSEFLKSNDLYKPRLKKRMYCSLCKFRFSAYFKVLSLYTTPNKDASFSKRYITTGFILEEDE